MPGPYRLLFALLLVAVWMTPAMLYGAPLHEAASKGNVEEIKLLIAKGADVNAKNNSGNTPLHRAASSGGVEVPGLSR